MSGQADGEERRPKSGECVLVLADELNDVLVVFTHVDGGSDDHAVVSRADRVSHVRDVVQLDVVAEVAKYVADVRRSSRFVLRWCRR